jgi:hypothetical protein
LGLGASRLTGTQQDGEFLLFAALLFLRIGTVILVIVEKLGSNFPVIVKILSGTNPADRLN